jgi:flagellar hook-associated protein 1
MGGLLDALNIGRSAITAARAGVQITGHNISNADTDGYHRRTLRTSPVDPPISQTPILGGGVQVDGMTRAEDWLLATRVASSLGDEAWASAREALMLQVERAAGGLGDGGLGEAITSLMTRFSALATSPTDPTVRETVVFAARNLAETFNRIDTAMREVVQGAHTTTETLVTSVNTRSAKIAELNAQIVQSEGGGMVAGDLRDRRDLLVSELAATAGASYFEDASGQVTVLVGGHTLVQDDSAWQISSSQALDGSTRISVAQGGDITAAVTSGELGGLLSVQQTVLQEVVPELDQLAFDLASAVNTQNQAGFVLSGAAGGALFSIPASATDAARTISLAAGVTGQSLAASSTAGGVPGNNENALALAALVNQPLTGGNTATEAAAAMVGKVGTLTDQAMMAANLRKDELTYLQMLRQSSEGVSLDEEMVQLIQYQRAYQAGVKVLQTIDECLERLMTIG